MARGGSRTLVVCACLLLAALLAAVASPVATASGTLASGAAYVTDSGQAFVVPIDASGNPLDPIPVEGDPTTVAISPDASTVYVAGAGAQGVQFIDRASGTVQATVSLGAAPSALAVSPDGKTVYATVPASNEVVPIDVATETAGQPITVGTDPEGVAFAPDGQTAYVADEGSGSVPGDVSVIDVATGSVVASIPVAGGPESIAVTPNGSMAYVADEDGTVTPIDLATSNTETPIQLSGSPGQIAIAPDGQTAYVTIAQPSNTVEALDLVSGVSKTVIGLGLTGSGLYPLGVAFSPDGSTAYVTESGLGEAVLEIDVATGTPITTVHVGFDPTSVAFAPAQPPAAAFVASPAAPGSATSFNASGSTDADSTITSYAWNFGDGSTATTPNPTTTHVYQAPGTYTATLTVTDANGCSTAFVFTGQTASCNGSGVASVSRTVDITQPAPPPPPTTTPTPQPSMGSVPTAVTSTTPAAPGVVPAPPADTTTTPATAPPAPAVKRHTAGATKRQATRTTTSRRRAAATTTTKRTPPPKRTPPTKASPQSKPKRPIAPSTHGAAAHNARGAPRIHHRHHESPSFPKHARSAPHKQRSAPARHNTSSHPHTTRRHTVAGSATRPLAPIAPPHATTPRATTPRATTPPHQLAPSHHTASRQNPDRSPLAAALRRPNNLPLAPADIARSLGIALLLLVLLGLPARVFGMTVKNNRRQLAAWFERVFRTLGKSRELVPERLRAALGVAGTSAVAAAVVHVFLNPGFPTRPGSAALAVGMLLGWIVLVSNTVLTWRWYRRGLPHSSRWHVYPGQLAFCALCVIISRLAHFVPGLMMGMAGDYEWLSDAELEYRAKRILFTNASLAILALSAWAGSIPVADAAARPGAGFVVLAGDAALSVIAVAGMEILTFTMLPLHFLDGYVLFKWRRWVWLAVWSVGAIWCSLVIINPVIAGPEARAGVSAGWLVLLFAVECVIAFGLWSFFVARRRQRGDSQPEVL